MAKKDCSPLARLVTDIIRDLVQTRNLSLDDAVFELQKTFPIVSRESVIDNILEATAQTQRQATEDQKRWRAVLREVREDKGLTVDNEKITEYLAHGELPPPKAKPTTQASETIKALRRTHANVRKWLKTSDPAMRIRLLEKLDALNERIASGESVVDERNRGKLHETLQSIEAEIKATQKQVASAKVVGKLEEQIATLQKHLDEGTLPDRHARPERGEGAADSLRNVRDALKKKLAASEPAVKERLEKRMADLDDIIKHIEDGTYEPPEKTTKSQLSNELAYLQLQTNEKAARVRQLMEDMKPRPFLTKLWVDWNPFTFIINWLTTGEASIILRQGKIALVGRTGETVEKALMGKPTLEPLGRTVAELREIPGNLLSKERTERRLANMMADPDWKLFRLAKGHVWPISEEGQVSDQAEWALSRLGWKLPVMRDINRAASMFLTQVGFHQFKAGIRTLTINGEPTLNEAKVIANMANQGTGRGYEGGGALGEGARMFFSFQFLTSRFKLLVGQPIWGGDAKSAARARLLVAREYGRIGLGFAVYYAMAAALGAEIEKDPRSSAFLTIKFGRHYIDPLAGLKQLIVFGARLATGKKKNVGTGEIISLRGPGHEFGKATIQDVEVAFGRSKLAPLPSFVGNMLAGEDVNHQPVTLTGELLKFSHPMTYDDIWHAMEEDGFTQDMMAASLYFLGEGGWTYQPEESPSQSAPRRRRQ